MAIDFETSKRAFSIKIETEEYKAIAPKGYYVCFDPDAEISSGKYVIANFEDDEELHIMQYKIFAGKKTLRPVLGDYAAIELNDETKANIVAVATKRFIPAEDIT